MAFMTVFTFDVKVATDNLDCEVVTDSLVEALREALPDGTLVLARPDKVTQYDTEQGWKNARKRVFNISVKDAGDSHKSKSQSLRSATVDSEEVEQEASA